MKNREKTTLIIVNIVCVLALLAVIFPLLMIARYNYPSADDWSYGVAGYNAIKRGEGISGVLKGSLETVKDNYLHWEGRFVNSFLASLQPGIWGEKYYGIVAWLMIGSIIFSEIFLCAGLLGKGSGRANRLLAVPIIVPPLILQILYSPYPEESFYWYTGSVNYTFVYGLSLVLLTLFLKMAAAERPPKWKYGLWAVIACVLAVLVGGDNFATSLSSFLTLLILSALFLCAQQRKPHQRKLRRRNRKCCGSHCHVSGALIYQYLLMDQYQGDSDDSVHLAFRLESGERHEFFLQVSGAVHAGYLWALCFPDHGDHVCGRHHGRRKDGGNLILLLLCMDSGQCLLLGRMAVPEAGVGV